MVQWSNVSYLAICWAKQPWRKMWQYAESLSSISHRVLRTTTIYETKTRAEVITDLGWPQFGNFPHRLDSSRLSSMMQGFMHFCCKRHSWPECTLNKCLKMHLLVYNNPVQVYRWAICAWRLYFIDPWSKSIELKVSPQTYLLQLQYYKIPRVNISSRNNYMKFYSVIIMQFSLYLLC